MRRPALLALAVLAFLLALVGLATYAVAQQAEQRESALVDARARDVASEVRGRLGTYTEKLYGLRGYLVGSRTISRIGLHRSVVSQRYDRRFPGIQVVGVAELIRRTDVAREAARIGASARRSGLPYPRFVLHPPGPRSVYLPIVALEPQRGNEKAFGFDFLSEANRRRAVRRTVVRALPAATGPVRLVQEHGDQRAFLTMLALYRGTEQAPAMTERERLFRGVVYSAVRMGDLLRPVLASRRGADLEVYDVGPLERPAARPTPADRTFATVGAPIGGGDLARDLPIEVAGRRWLLRFATDGSPLSASERALPWIVGGLGLLASLLAAGVVLSLTSARARALALADGMTRDLRASRNELQERNEDLEQFAFLASHDLQQPLRTVSGFLQLLVHQRGGQLDDRAREYVDHAVAGTRDMARLIDDLLAYSRAGREEMKLRPVAADAAWDAAVAQLRAAVDASGGRVTRDALPVVLADQPQLTQVLANLIGNALKYHGDRPPVVHGEARRDGDVWEIAVRDEGVGVDPADHERIFGMFRRLHRPGDAEGSGAGLAIAKKLVERAGGTIRVESPRGGGARFVVRLHAAPDGGGHDPGAAQAPRADPAAVAA